MNTNVPNTFATDGKIVLSGAGRKAVYEGAGVMDDIKKGYNKTRSAVKSKTGQKIVGALKEDKSVMKEFTKAKKTIRRLYKWCKKNKTRKSYVRYFRISGCYFKN